MGSIVSAQKVASQMIGIPYQEYLIKIQSKKWCTKCRQWHKKDEFNIDNSRGDKLSTKCHHCTRVKVKKSTKGRVSPFKEKKHSASTIAKLRLINIDKNPPMQDKNNHICHTNIQ